MHSNTSKHSCQVPFYNHKIIFYSFFKQIFCLGQYNPLVDYIFEINSILTKMVKILIINLILQLQIFKNI